MGILNYAEVRSQVTYHFRSLSSTSMTYSLLGDLLISHVTQCTTFS